MTNAAAAIDIAEESATRTADAAVDFASALSRFLKNPTDANASRMYAAEAAFGNARAAEAIAKGNAILAMLAA